jgi:hypothetical protein
MAGASLGWAMSEGVNAWVIVGTIAAVGAFLWGPLAVLCQAWLAPKYRRSAWRRTRFIAGEVTQDYEPEALPDLTNIPPGKSLCVVLLRPSQPIDVMSINVRFIEANTDKEADPSVIQVEDLRVRAGPDSSVPRFWPLVGPPEAGVSRVLAATTQWSMPAATGTYLLIGIEALQRWNGRLSIRVTARDAELPYLVRLRAYTERPPERWANG